MFNFAFFVKAFEIIGDPPEKITKLMDELSQFIIYKFNTMLILYINEKIDDDDEFEKFAKLVEQADEKINSPETMAQYIQWLQANSQINMTEFMGKFEDEVFQIELRLIRTLAKNLDNKQKIDLIKFLEEQNKYEKNSLADIKKELKK